MSPKALGRRNALQYGSGLVVWDLFYVCVPFVCWPFSHKYYVVLGTCVSLIIVYLLGMFLASQPALEVMYVSQSVSEWVTDR